MMQKHQVRAYDPEANDPIATASSGWSTSPGFFTIGSQYDIYHDPNLREVQLVQAPLHALSTRLSELLQEWPEHPVLIQIIDICKRILHFPATSSVMQVVNGLEILLTKCQDWERTASRTVSLQTPHLDRVSELVIRWRHLELTTWKDTLKQVERKCCATASTLWFNIYQIVHGHPWPGAEVPTTAAIASKMPPITISMAQPCQMLMRTRRFLPKNFWRSPSSVVASQLFEAAAPCFGSR